MLFEIQMEAEGMNSEAEIITISTHAQDFTEALRLFNQYRETCRMRREDAAGEIGRLPADDEQVEGCVILQIRYFNKSLTN